MKVSNKVQNSIKSVQESLLLGSAVVVACVSLWNGAGDAWNTLDSFCKDADKQPAEIALFIPEVIANSGMSGFKGALYGASSMSSFVLLAVILEIIKRGISYSIRVNTEE